jgi:hypothetical protein
MGGGLMNVIGATMVKDLSSNGASDEARNPSTATGGGIRDKSIRMRLTD